jgi:hypothetical protein
MQIKKFQRAQLFARRLKFRFPCRCFAEWSFLKHVSLMQPAAAARTKNDLPYKTAKKEPDHHLQIEAAN